MKKLTMVSLAFMLLTLLFMNSGVSAEKAKKALKVGNASYYGEVKSGKPHGKGTMNWGNGKTYSGDWVQGKRSGLGTMKTKSVDVDGTDVYTGGWANDKKNGSGISTVFTTVGSEIVSGIYKDNQFLYGNSASSVMGYIQFTNTTKNGDQFFFILYSQEDAEELIKSGAKKGDLAHLTSMKRDTTGLYKGFSYADSMEGAWAGWTEGTYKETNHYDQRFFTPYNAKGTELDDSEGSIKTVTYTKGNSKYVQLKPGSTGANPESFYNTFYKKMDSKRPLIKAHLSEFKNLYNKLPKTDWEYNIAS